MPGLSDEELGKYIEEVIQSTKDGLIKWEPANPTTYVWDKAGPPSVRLTLQLVMRTRTSIEENRRVVKNLPYYILNVYEFEDTGRLNLREGIDGSEREALDKSLGGLFNLIRDERIQKDREFLRGTLPRR